MARKDVLKGRSIVGKNIFDTANQRIEAIKRANPLVDYFQKRGVRFSKTGSEYRGLCPFHDDHTPSLSVNEAKRIFHCFGCGKSGTVIDAAAYYEHIGTGEALELLEKNLTASGTAQKREENTPDDIAGPDAAPVSAPIASAASDGVPPVPPVGNPPTADESEPEPDDTTPAPSTVSLQTIADYYHKKLYENEKAIAYLKKRGFVKPELYERYQIGYPDGSMPDMIGEQQKEELTKLGILRENGVEHFKNCIVFPITDEHGITVSMYGRSIDATAAVPHLYLKGPHTGVFNCTVSKAYKEVIFTESIHDALSLIQLGFENTQAIYGTNGFTAEHLRILKEDRVKTIILAFDADDAGARASELLKEKLLAEGFAVKIISPATLLMVGENGRLIACTEPCRSEDREASCKDWNEYLCDAPDGEAIRQAIEQTALYQPKEVPAFTVVKDQLGYTFTYDDVTYRVSGVKEFFVNNLRVNIKASFGEEHYYDNLDLYSARSRTAYSINFGRECSRDQKRIEKELVQVLEYLEGERERRLSSARQDAVLAMSREEIALGMELLRDPHFFERLVSDMDSMGYVGEGINKQLLFTAASSRTLDDPLAVMVISQSAGGKTKLVETVEEMIPPEAVISVTSLSDQALNYVNDMEHKFLVLGEAVHGDAVQHQLRDIQASHRLRRGVVVQDPKTGKSETRFMMTKAVVSCALTGTTRDINPENASRNFIIEVDESAEQTARVHGKQQGKYSLERQEAKEITIPRLLKAYHAAGRLLQKEVIVNRFAKHIRFPVHLMRTRRDYERFLDLIAAISFVRQFQKTHYRRDTIEYIRCDLDDYAIAYPIIMKVLSSTLFELSGGTVDFYEKLRELARRLGRKRNLKGTEVLLTQREIREYTGFGQQWVKKQLRILVEYDYVIRVKGGSERSRGFYRIREDEPIGMIDLSIIPTPEALAELMKNDPDEDAAFALPDAEV